MNYHNGTLPNNIWHWNEKKTYCQLDTGIYNINAYHQISLKLSIFSHKEESVEMVEELVDLIATQNHSSIVTRGRMDTTNKGLVWVSIYFANGRKEVECPPFMIRKAFSDGCFVFPNDIQQIIADNKKGGGKCK